jgi:hypothetical protein
MSDNPISEFERDQLLRPKTEHRILWETQKTNEYLRVLIGLFLKAHPEAATKEVNQELQEIKDKKPPIGFDKP